MFHQGLCYPHFGRWKLAGRPDRAAWAASADPVAVRPERRCKLPGCRFPPMGKLALQCRHDARRARLEPVAFRNAARWIAEFGAASLMDRTGRFFEHAARERFVSALARNCGCPELAWVRYVRARLQDLRDEHGGVEVWEWDTWTIERIGVDARYAHQPSRRIYFGDIEPGWLRALAKGWAR